MLLKHLLQARLVKYTVRRQTDKHTADKHFLAVRKRAFRQVAGG